MYDSNKRSNIHIIRIPDGKQKKSGLNSIQRINQENFPNVMKDINIQIQKQDQISKKVSSKKSTP